MRGYLCAQRANPIFQLFIESFLSMCLCAPAASETICHGGTEVTIWASEYICHRDTENTEIEVKNVTFDAYHGALCASEP